MAEQRLLYSLEGDASGLKKALAEAEAAHSKLSIALTRKLVASKSLDAAQAKLKEIDTAAAKLRAQLDTLRRGVTLDPSSLKAFAKEIQQVEKNLDRLNKQRVKQNAVVGAQSSVVAGGGIGVLVAQENLINASKEKRLALIRAEALENERVAAIERRRAADELAGTRAAQAAARQRIAAQQQVAQSAQATARIEAATRLQSDRGEIAVKQGRLLSQAQAQAFANTQRLTVATQQQNAAIAQSGNTANAARAQFFSYAAALLSVGAAIQGINAITTAGTQLQALESTLLFSTGSAEKAASAYAFVRQEAERLGLPLNVLGKQFGQLSAAANGTALEGEATRKIFSSVASAARVMGLQAFQVERALLAVQQIMSKGTVQAEELRGQLGEQIPGAFNIAARAMKVTTAELNDLLKAGEVLSEDFLPKFAAELQRTVDPAVPAAVKTYAAEIERLKNTFQIFLQKVGKSGALEAISAQVVIVTQKLREMSDSGELKPAIDEIVSALSLLAQGLAEVAEFIAKNGDTIFRLAEAYALFKVATIGIGLVKTAAEFGGLATATASAAGATTALGVALRGITGLGIVAVFAFTADRLIKLVQVMREANRIEEDMNNARRKRNNDADLAIVMNSEYAATVTKTADEIKSASDKERLAYAESLKGAVAYYTGLQQQAQRNVEKMEELAASSISVSDVDGQKVAGAAISAAQNSVSKLQGLRITYRKALREFDSISDARLKLEAKQATEIKRIKDGETATIKLAVEAQIAAVKKARDVLRDHEKELADIAKDTVKFQAELSKAGQPEKELSLVDAAGDVGKVRTLLAGGDAQGALDQIEVARQGLVDLAKAGQEAPLFLQSFARELGVLALQAGEQQRAAAEENAQEQERKLLTLQSLAVEIGRLEITADVSQAETEMQDLRTRTQAFYDANPIIVKIVTQRQDDIDLGIEKAPKKATGGAINGPGSGTSDSILMFGSNGEHVLTAKEVAAAGGHAEIYRLRALIRAGRLRDRLPGFAAGGAIHAQAKSITSRMRQTMLNPLPDYAARIGRNINVALAGIPAYAAGGAIGTGAQSGTPINLTLEGLGTFALSGPVDTAAELQRTVARVALSRGRRR